MLHNENTVDPCGDKDRTKEGSPSSPIATVNDETDQGVLVAKTGTYTKRKWLIFSSPF